MKLFKVQLWCKIDNENTFDDYKYVFANNEDEAETKALEESCFYVYGAKAIEEINEIDGYKVICTFTGGAI